MVPIEIIVQFSMLFDHDISTNEDIYEHIMIADIG